MRDFCKVDAAGRAINISETRLKNIGEDLYVVDFVADAFTELKTLCKNSTILKDDKYKNLQPKKGWTNLHNKYHEYLNEIFNEYIKETTSTHKNTKIDSFEAFVLSYVRFLDKVIYKTPFVKSSYVASDLFHTTDTGFIIDLEIDKSDDDTKKFTDYYDNIEFIHFSKLCEQTNFSIDKDCPWRLVYNTFSDMSQTYMKKYNINKNNLIEQYFYITEDFDLKNLKQYFMIMYNTFVSIKPTAQKVKVITYNNKQIINTEFIDRQPITKETLNSKYPDQFWFSIYSHFLFVENKLDLTSQQYQKIMKELNTSFSLYGYNLTKEELKTFISKTPSIQTKGEYVFVLPSTT